MKSRRIGLITSWPLSFAEGSGTATYVRAWMAAMRARGYEVRLFGYRSPFRHYGLQLLDRVRWNRWALPRQIASARPDRLVALDWEGLFLDRPAEVQLPLAIFADIAPTEPGLYRWALRWQARMEARALQRAPVVVAISRFARERISRRYGRPEARIELIYPGFDHEAWLALLRAQTRRPRQIPEVLAVARLYPRKGIRYLLEAGAELNRRAVSWRATIVGDGQEAQALRALAERLGLQAQLRWAGAVEDRAHLAYYYRNADVFCHPSLHETFGFVLLEAMAAGLPVVAAQAASMPELVEEGRTGLLVAPAQPQALADGLERLLRDPERRRLLGEAAQERARGFSWQTTAAAFEALLA
ncbi:MAG: glycosyltransferase family 4 protein [Bacteroidetes bacterium]|nr:glycosyltransferase family 4 protein [Rhodothermia bacterium]MCS7155846.1 glycosyltransferase family 4 protein [Bacteroidota bacterium]MCX7906053.1 glycosyltransferase family 4 protein [Bacteroidota bacterium]MDW8138181.1 glycosyltransferase family 4 protein [Bacteroidota bacterium]MDW8285865.1 glycosyltransferase family 4 protein [Bacteroidota bacterium]